MILQAISNSGAFSSECEAPLAPLPPPGQPCGPSCAGSSLRLVARPPVFHVHALLAHCSSVGRRSWGRKRGVPDRRPSPGHPLCRARPGLLQAFLAQRPLLHLCLQCALRAGRACSQWPRGPLFAVEGRRGAEEGLPVGLGSGVGWGQGGLPTWEPRERPGGAGVGVAGGSRATPGVGGAQSPQNCRKAQSSARGSEPAGGARPSCHIRECALSPERDQQRPQGVRDAGSRGKFSAGSPRRPLGGVPGDQAYLKPLGSRDRFAPSQLARPALNQTPPH